MKRNSPVTGVQDSSQYESRTATALHSFGSLGDFKRGMNLKVARSGKDIRTIRRYPFYITMLRYLRKDLGDIIGIPNYGTLQLGDTLTKVKF